MIPSEEWRADAACRGMDVDLFYPSTGELIPAECVAACARCTVVTECLADACETESSENMTIGYRAGMSANARMAYRANGLRSGEIVRRGRPPIPIAHGTERGWAQHRRRKERPCVACMAGHSAAQQGRKELADVG